LKIKTSQPFPFFPCLKIEDASPARFKTKFSKKYFTHRNGLFQFPVIISFTVSRRSTQIPTTIILYTMETPTLKWPLRIGAPKSTSDNSTFSNNEGSTPNANDTPTFFTLKHYNWLLQYQQLFKFYLVHGHTNVTRRNADNSLAEWASYQRSKMAATDKHDVKWKHLLNGIGFCSSPPPTPNQVFEKHLLAYNVICGTRNAITPKKADSKDLHGWWKYWRQQRKHFLSGEPRKIKDHDLQKIFDLYSAGIFSGISFEMQNGLPSRMHQLSIAQGVSNIHPL
jgi:hypothetical protein